MFALVDCNNFYASCERVFNPNLYGQPIAILSNNDGCVISRSDEAKTLGLPMGAPIFKWDAFCRAQQIRVLSSNYPLYGDMSSRVMSILGQFSPDIELYSIDESFLKFQNFKKPFDFKNYGLQIRTRILKWTGIPTSIGIAPTKALSKVANKVARKFPERTKGVYIIDSEEKRLKALKWIKIEDVWGIGRALTKKLKLKNCKTAYDFTQLSNQWIKNHFSIIEMRLKLDLEGVSSLYLEEYKTKKSIATTRSFEYVYSDINNIKERISTFAINCAEKLRKQKSSCHVIVVMLRSDRFKKNSPQHKVNAAVNLSYPTNSSLIINNCAINAVNSIFKKGIKYKRAGVIVMGLVPEDHFQLNLFENENPKHPPLMSTVDFLNKKYGAFKIKVASQDLQRTWKMRQKYLSPKYTTNINDIIVVK